MTTVTLGTAAATSLVAVQFQSSLSAADLATIALLIKDISNPTKPVIPEAFSRFGRLVIPNRGILNVNPGDYVATDGLGSVILVPKEVAGSAPWVHT